MKIAEIIKLYKAGISIDTLEKLTDVSGAEGTEGTEGAEGTEGTEGAEGTEGTEGAEGTEGTEGTEGNEGADDIINSLNDWKKDFIDEIKKMNINNAGFEKKETTAEDILAEIINPNYKKEKESE